MAKAFTGRTRIRKTFGRIAEVAPMPNLIEVQKNSYDHFLQAETALTQRGLLVPGIDVIGPYLTEINVTSPTGIRQVKQFGGADIAALIWDAIEAKV